jgi:hypothetical protein
MYEITFLGQAGTTLRAEFEDCEVTLGPGTTTLRAELPDRGALSGLMERINSLGLDVIDVSLVAPSPGQLPGTGHPSGGDDARGWRAGGRPDPSLPPAGAAGPPVAPLCSRSCPPAGNDGITRARVTTSHGDSTG